MGAVITALDVETKCQKYCAQIESRLISVEDILPKKADLSVVETLIDSLPQKADKRFVDNLDAKVVGIEQNIKDLCTDISKLDVEIRETQNEAEEIAKRANNLVIRGLDESSNDADLAVVTQILCAICCQDVEVISTSRLGPEGKSQPSESGAGAQNPTVTNKTQIMSLLR